MNRSCSMLMVALVMAGLPAATPVVGIASTSVSINPSVVTKLSDRGSFQAIGLVTDIEPFLRELTEFLAKEGG